MAAGERTRIDSIAEVEAIAAIGPRGPGTDAERRAARHLAARAESLGPQRPHGVVLHVAALARRPRAAARARRGRGSAVGVAARGRRGTRARDARGLSARRRGGATAGPPAARAARLPERDLARARRAARRARAGGAHGLGAHGLRPSARHPPAPPPPPAGARVACWPPCSPAAWRAWRAWTPRRSPLPSSRSRSCCSWRWRCGGHLALPRRDRRRRQCIGGRSRPSRRGTAGRHARALRSPSAAHRSAGERGRRRDARVRAPSPLASSRATAPCS